MYSSNLGFEKDRILHAGPRTPTRAKYGFDKIEAMEHIDMHD